MMLQLFVKGQKVNISELIKKYRSELTNNGYAIVSSNSPIDHTAAFVAWQDVQGALISLPKISCQINPTPHEKKLLLDSKKFYNQDVMILTSSGTTAPQSLVTHTRNSVLEITKRSAEMQQLSSGCRVGGNLPPFTSGFYNILLQTSYYLGGELHIWDWTTENCPDIDHAVISAGQVDLIKSRKINIDLHRLKTVTTGASPVLQRHGEFLLQSGARSMKQIYGLTQLGTPFLMTPATADPVELPWLDLKTVEKYSDFRFVDDELQVKNTTISIDKSNYITDDGWFMTGDFWTQNNGRIKFDVRNNEKIKLNDYVVKLSIVEEILNNTLDFVDCIAFKKTRLGVDYLHVIYQSTNEIENIDSIKSEVGKYLPSYSVPLSFEKVSELPRTALGKKKRW